MNDATCCGVSLGGLLTPALFRALGDTNRIALLDRVARSGGCCTVTEAAECMDIDVSVVSRHLATLRDAGILEATKDGRKVLYRLRARELAILLRQIADALDQCCGPTAPAEDRVHPGPVPG